MLINHFRKLLGVVIAMTILFFIIDWLTNNPVKNSEFATVDMYCLGTILLIIYLGLFVTNAQLLISGSHPYSTPFWLYLILDFALCTIYGPSLISTATSIFSVVTRIAFFFVLPIIALIDYVTKPRT